MSQLKLTPTMIAVIVLAAVLLAPGILHAALGVAATLSSLLVVWCMVSIVVGLPSPLRMLRLVLHARRLYRRYQHHRVIAPRERD